MPSQHAAPAPVPAPRRKLTPALAKNLHIDIDTDSDSDMDALSPFPRTPTPTPSSSSSSSSSSSLHSQYPLPPPFPASPALSTSTYKHLPPTPSAHRPRPTRRAVLYYTETSLATLERESLRPTHAPSTAALETMGDVYTARHLGFRADNLQRALLCFRSARRLAAPGGRDAARLAIKMGRVMFDLCDIPLTVKVKVKGKVKERRGLKLAEHVKKRITDALAMIDDGLEAYTNRPEWCDRPRDARAYVSAFVSRGLVFDALYRSLGCPLSTRPRPASDDSSTTMLSKTHTETSTITAEVRRGLATSSSFSGLVPSASTPHKRSKSFDVDAVRLADDEDDANADERKRLLGECMASLDLALSAGTDMISINSSLQSPTTTAPAFPALLSPTSTVGSGPNTPPPSPEPNPQAISTIAQNKSQIIRKCRVAVERVERLRVILALARAHLASRQPDAERVKSLAASILDTPFSPGKAGAGTGGKGVAAQGQGHGQVYLCTDGDEVDQLKDELKVIAQLVAAQATSNLNPSLARCVIC